MKQEKSAGLVIYYLENSEPLFLLLKYKNYWGFVKGIIEEGEKIEETILRESKEEANLTPKIIEGFKQEQSWFYKLKGELISKKALFLIGEITKEQASNTKISFEHEDFKWLNFEEAKKLMSIKQNLDLLKSAHDFIKQQSKQKKLF